MPGFFLREREREHVCVPACLCMRVCTCVCICVCLCVLKCAGVCWRVGVGGCVRVGGVFMCMQILTSVTVQWFLLISWAPDEHLVASVS